MACWLDELRLEPPGSFGRKRKRDWFCSNIGLRKGLSRGCRRSTFASRCCSIMPDASKRPVGRASFGGCANIWGGIAKGFLMPPRCEPRCSESLRSPTWSRCLPVSACTARVSPRAPTKSCRNRLLLLNSLRRCRCHSFWLPPLRAVASYSPCWASHSTSKAHPSRSG